MYCSDFLNYSIIYGSSGIVDKHLGDGMMAIFGLSGAPALQAALGAGRQIVQAIKYSREFGP